MAEFKGDTFYNEKIDAMMKSLAGMESLDALTLLPGLVARIMIEISKGKDLGFVQKLLVILQERTLDLLTEKGWK